MRLAGVSASTLQPGHPSMQFAQNRFTQLFAMLPADDQRHQLRPFSAPTIPGLLTLLRLCTFGFKDCRERVSHSGVGVARQYLARGVLQPNGAQANGKHDHEKCDTGNGDYLAWNRAKSTPLDKR